MKQKTIFLNMKTAYGIETVDQFSPEQNQSNKDFSKYVRQMKQEYYMAGMPVYSSQRPTNDWKSN